MLYTLFRESHRKTKNQKMPDHFPISSQVRMPAEYLQKNGSKIMFLEEFFKDEFLQTISKDDTVVIWIGLDNESQIDKFSKLDCRKFLRNIDVAKSDRILFINEKKLVKRIDFDGILMCYPSEKYIKIFSNLNVSCIPYPHLLDFDSYPGYEDKHRQCDILISGQQSESYYPLRHKIVECLASSENISIGKYTIKYLHHPGWGSLKSDMRHDILNETYVDFLSNFRMAITCGGGLDSMYMKYLEMAAAYTLPIGEKISYMPEAASNAMITITNSDTSSDILKKVTDLLSKPEELEERTKIYCSTMSKFFNIDIETKKVVSKILNKNDKEKDLK